MKKLCSLLVAGFMAFSVFTFTVSAQSLDDVIGDNNSTQVTQQNQGTGNSGGPVAQFPGMDGEVGNKGQVDEMKKATELDEPSSGASAVNQGIKKVASFIIQVLAYAVTILLVLRVLLDIFYITIPFTRNFLANGHQGNGQAAAGAPGMAGMQGGMGMGGMNGGMGGMGMGGMSGGMGMGMGGMGMRGGMGMGGMNGMQAGMNQGGTGMLRSIQWVSTAALNAVAAETVIGPDGKAVGPLKVYAKDMIVVLVLTPIFLVLAITGALTNLGFMLGELIARAISAIQNMF